MIDAEQVRLRLTNSKEILKELKRRKALHTDSRGEKLVLQYDGQVFDFRPGVVVTVGVRVGKALVRSSQVIMGDDLTGDVKPALEIVSRFQLGEEAPEEATHTTVCPVCKRDCYNLTRLSKHLLVAHRTDRPDLYESKAPTGKIDWETPIEEEGETTGETEGESAE